MKQRITSSSRLTLDNVVALASELAKRGDSADLYSSAIELALSEIVRDCMRRTVQSRTPMSSEGLLEGALQESFGQVEGELRQAEVRLPLGQYREQIKKTLKPVASEMEKLGERLAHAKQMGKLALAVRMDVDEPDLPPLLSSVSAGTGIVATQAHSQYEVCEIGLRGHTEGLLVQPTGDSFEINLDDLPEGFTVQGDWFPYEVHFEDILFVLDDDGSIHVSVENFPERLVAQVREYLHKLARRVYG